MFNGILLTAIYECQNYNMKMYEVVRDHIFFLTCIVW